MDPVDTTTFPIAPARRVIVDVCAAPFDVVIDAVDHGLSAATRVSRGRA